MAITIQQSARNGPIDPAVGIRVSRIIWGAMLAGMVLFACVTLTISRNAPKPMVLTPIGLLLGLVAIGARFTIPQLVASARMNASEVKQIDPIELNRRLYPIFQTKTIIGLALMEAAIFFNGICYMLEHHWWSFAMILVLFSLMALMFPTLNRFEEWANEQRQNALSNFDS